MILLVLLATIDYHAELEAAGHAELIPIFDKARAAIEANNAPVALELSEEVLAKAPDFQPALRVKCYAQLNEKQTATAVQTCKRAVALGPRNDANLMALARAYDEDAQPTLAMETIDRAVAVSGSEKIDALLLKCQIALRTKNFPVLARAADELVAQNPEPWEAWAFASVGALSENNLSAARERLERAKAAGMPADQRERISGYIDEATPWYDRYLRPAFYVALAWGGICAFLFLAGTLLSALTLRQARALPTDRSGRASGASAFLRRAYAGVILASCLFYYISVPLVLLVVVAAGGGLIYAFFALGRIPIKLVAIIGFFVVVTVIAIVRSLFVRARDVDPGTKLDFSEAPKLRALLDEVAGKVGTRAVDNVYLTPGTDLAVMERGSFRKRLSGNTERCLILGVGVLDGLSQAEMKSVLAHEYGHFSNRDTAGGGLALSVRNSLVHMAHGLAEGGAAAWYNPAWWFFQGFWRVFLRISQGSTRLQEVLADRWAAYSYGSENFVNGLTHAIKQSIHFDAHASATLNQVIENKAALSNLYSFTPAQSVEADTLEAQLEEALEREPSPYDSHPSPKDRFAWVRALSVSDQTVETDTRPSWDLFNDRAAMEQRMTAEIRVNIAAAHGIQLEG